MPAQTWLRFSTLLLQLPPLLAEMVGRRSVSAFGFNPVFSQCHEHTHTHTSACQQRTIGEFIVAGRKTLNQCRCSSQDEAKESLQLHRQTFEGLGFRIER